jgi:hypothetical protein
MYSTWLDPNRSTPDRLGIGGRIPNQLTKAMVERTTPLARPAPNLRRPSTARSSNRRQRGTVLGSPNKDLVKADDDLTFFASVTGFRA